MVNQSIPVSICSNPKCEELIYSGDDVWKKGRDLYCNIHCLYESFNAEEEEDSCQSK